MCFTIWSQCQWWLRQCIKSNRKATGPLHGWITQRWTSYCLDMLKKNDPDQTQYNHAGVGSRGARRGSSATTALQQCFSLAQCFPLMEIYYAVWVWTHCMRARVSLISGLSYPSITKHSVNSVVWRTSHVWAHFVGVSRVICATRRGYLLHCVILMMNYV